MILGIEMWMLAIRTSDDGNDDDNIAAPVDNDDVDVNDGFH